MPTLAVASLIRNEINHWLPSVLNAWTSFADTVIILDDNSNDGTYEYLQKQPKVQLFQREDKTPMWGQEVIARQELWRLAVQSKADWIMIADGDMVPACDPSILFTGVEPDAVAFLLYDLWSINPYRFRYDGFWQAHNAFRIWAVRNPGPGFEDAWPARGIHCGHFPHNLPVNRALYAPPEYGLLHLAYSDEESRQRKLEQYMSKAGQLSRQEYEHAASITEHPMLADFSYPVQWRLERACVYKEPDSEAASMEG